jgi:hypothetical protein
MQAPGKEKLRYRYSKFLSSSQAAETETLSGATEIHLVPL